MVLTNMHFQQPLTIQGRSDFESGFDLMFHHGFANSTQTEDTNLINRRWRTRKTY